MQLRNDGPIRREHGNRVIGEFVSGDFVAPRRRHVPNGVARTVRAFLRADAAQAERLCQEFNEMAELDSYLPSEKEKTIGMSVGTKPIR